MYSGMLGAVSSADQPHGPCPEGMGEGLHVQEKEEKMILPFRKILCPTDFSESSYEAIKTAGELAFHFGSELSLLHVVSPVPIVPAGAEPLAFDVLSYEQELEAFSKKSLQEVADQLEWKDLKVRLIALRGIAADERPRRRNQEGTARKNILNRWRN
jgi:hypothetical protein